MPWGQFLTIFDATKKYFQKLLGEKEQRLIYGLHDIRTKVREQMVYCLEESGLVHNSYCTSMYYCNAFNLSSCNSTVHGYIRDEVGGLNIQ